MKPWLFWLLPLAFLAVACSADEGDVSATATPGMDVPAVSGPLPDLMQAGDELLDLIVWDSFFYARNEDPPERLHRLVEALGASDDQRYRAFLVDLAFYPNPFTERARELLIGRPGPFTELEILTALEDEGFKQPEDDLPLYVEFKRRLLATIDTDVAAFVDPSQPHTISAQEVFWGGVKVDGIPPLNEPTFVSPAEAENWLLPEDYVIGVEINGDARAYPRRIIDWHEMVNDTVGGVPVSLAYCTLCGSAILYDGRHGDQVYRFGTSGLLYRSNKLMYDTATRSLWEQYTGEPAWGPLVGQGVSLEVLPIVHTTWDEWLAAHPETTVLSLNTGFFRNYGSVDGAGVAYAEYWESAGLIFPAPDRNGPLARKDYVYVVRDEAGLTVYPIDLLVERRFIQDTIGERTVVVVATADATGGRAYDRGGVEFESVDLAAGTLRSDDGRRWQISEEALIGEDGTRLERLPGHNSFWFAVLNHAPGWRLYEE